MGWPPRWPPSTVLLSILLCQWEAGPPASCYDPCFLIMKKMEVAMQTNWSRRTYQVYIHNSALYNRGWEQEVYGALSIICGTRQAFTHLADTCDSTVALWNWSLSQHVSKTCWREMAVWYLLPSLSLLKLANNSCFQKERSSSPTRPSYHCIGILRT